MSTFPVLVVNAGSSSLKYEVLDAVSGQTSASGIVERIGGAATMRHTFEGRTVRHDLAAPSHAEALDAAQWALREHGSGLDTGALRAVGHRVVHGGSRFSAPVVVDDEVIEAVRLLEPLAPLHNPANLEGILHARAAFPDLPHVAVFDTAFHQSLPAHAYTYAVPREWRELHRVRRYGFHGTSHHYVSRRTAELLGRDGTEVNTVVLHLGNGASACAVAGGRSVDTSMGMSPLEGLVMGTRPGDLDPALAAHLARTAGLTLDDYDRAVNTGSGLLGLTGTSDFRDLMTRREAGDADAALAFDLVAYRLRKYVGAYAVALGRLDAVAFTGGIGEHSPPLRAAVLGGLGLLGVELDAAANDAAVGVEGRVTSDGSRVAAFVVPTNEELEIARACLAVLGEQPSP